MFKNLKLSYKIGVGFGTVILLAVIVGLIASFTMVGVKTTSNQLSEEYIPEVEIANDIERYALTTMLDTRGYAFTEDRKYLEKGLETLGKVKESLQKANEFAQKHPNLVGLKQGVDKAIPQVDKFEGLVKKTETLINGNAEFRKKADEAAARYIENINQYLSTQEEKLASEIAAGADRKLIMERINKVKLGNRLHDLGNDIRIANFKFQALKDRSYIEKVKPNFDEIVGVVDQLLLITAQDANKNQLGLVKAAAEDYKAAVNNLEKNWDELQLLNAERLKASEDVVAAGKEISLKGIEQTKSKSKNASTSLNVSTVIIILGVAASIIIGIIVSLIIISGITRPIRNIVDSLSEGAGQITAASEQLSAASQQLAGANSEQAASIQETSATLEESSSMIQQNTENTKQAALLASQSRAVAEKGNTDMKEMITAIDEIKKSSDQISKIIKVIDEIAFQTNILALNAAVEAARAGEAGMGFAVVADEVRSLAQRSAQAAKDTSAMIEGNIELSGKGVESSRKVAESLAEIMLQAKKVNELMDEIAAASQEQSQGIGQINKAMGQMEQAIQQSAATSEESAAASEQLSAQAQTVMDIVSSLVELVEGHGSSSGNKSYSHNKKVKSMGYVNSARDFGHVTVKSRKKGEIVKNSNSVNPNDIIPLDEDSADF